MRETKLLALSEILLCICDSVVKVFAVQHTQIKRELRLRIFKDRLKNGIWQELESGFDARWN